MCLAAQLNSKGGGWYEEEIGIYCTSNEWDEREFENITREYLANTKVKIESEEHEIFVKEIVYDAGLMSLVSDGYVIIFDIDMETVSRAITLPLPPKEPKLPVASVGTKMPQVKEPKKVSMNEIKVNVTNNTNSLVQIKKSDDESSVFIYVNDPPKESEPKKPEPKKWPQVGDSTIYNDLPHKVVVPIPDSTGDLVL